MRIASQHREALRLGLIADDLAGACDAGVQFAARGLRSIVDLGRSGAAGDCADLRILNTNSRNDSPEVARAKVSEALRRLEHSGRTLIYKKVDSTLRGNLGAEIRAAMGVRRMAVVAPAFPALGRQIRDGCLYVAGVVQSHPIDLVGLLRQQSGMEVIHIKRRFFARGVKALRRQLEEISERGRSLVVMDTTVQRDLALIARAAWELRGPLPQESQLRPLMVGSAALAAEVAKLLRAKLRHPPVTVAPALRSRRQWGPVALIVGSTHPVSAGQCDYLLAHRRAVSITLAKDFVRTTRQALEVGQHLLIKVSQSAADEKRLKSLAATLADSRLRGIIMTGGDTANLVVRALDADGIILMREVLPGMPWGKLIGGPANGKPAATKAGGFGRPDALARLVDFLASLKTDCT